MPYPQSIRQIILSAIFAVFLLGCPKAHLGFNEPPAKSNGSIPNGNPSESAAALDSADTNPLDDIDLKNIVIDAEFLQQSDAEKLAAVARLLEAARTLLLYDQLVTAGYSFALARVMLTTIYPDSLGDDAELYHSLAKEVNYFYDDYVRGKDELPAESPPEAVIAGVEEAEADTLSDEDDLLNLRDLPVDTTALVEALGRKLAFPDVPLVMNKQVENAIRFFQTKGRKVYQRWLMRAEIYEPMMRRILREEGMPEELVYVSMIESGFNPIAYSYAHASGPWQFIKSTGRIFGLETNWWLDERRDPVKATYAAIRYLKKLYYDFGDWYLAIAAYNCGEKNVERQINRFNTKDFWKLSRLPRQTRNYVPTYIAAAIIAKDPAAYGFTPPVFRDLPPLDSVIICEQIDLKLAAKLIGSSYEELKELNPTLLKWCTPPPPDSTILILPDGYAAKFIEEWSKLPDDQKRIETRHIVRRGETLGSIARKYGTTVREICSVAENRIRNQNRLSVGQMLVIPVAPDHYKKSAVEYRVAETPEPSSSEPAENEIVHLVRSGETLGSIANHYKTTVSSLISRNRIRDARRLKVGQILIIKPGAAYSSGRTIAAAQPTKSKSNASPVKTQFTGAEYVIKKGETLTDIATRCGVSVADLQRANNIRDPCRIVAGTRLRIPKDAATENGATEPKTVHTVRPGDTLWAIAKRYGVNQDNLMRVNSLNKHSKLMPGDRIKIPQG